MTSLLARVASWFKENGTMLPLRPGVDEDFLKLGTDSKGKPVRLSKRSARAPIVVAGRPAATRDALILSMMTSAIESGGAGIIIRRSSEPTLFHGLHKAMAASCHVGDPLFLDLRAGEDRQGDRSPPSLTFNPFSAENRKRLPQALSEVLEHHGEPKWKGRSRAMLKAALDVVEWLRSQDLVGPMNIREFADYIGIRRLIDFVDPVMFPEMPDATREGVQAYLTSLPGYRADLGYNQPMTVLDQHGYLQKQLSKLITAFADHYPHVFLHDRSDVDLEEAIASSRCLVVELPQRALSGLEEAVARFILGLLRAALANVAEDHPTRSAPFLCVLDGVSLHLLGEETSLMEDARTAGVTLVLSDDRFLCSTEPENDIAKIMRAARAKVIAPGENVFALLGDHDPWEALELDQAVLNQVTLLGKRNDPSDFALVSNGGIHFGKADLDLNPRPRDPLADCAGGW